ncbi:MAG: extracellular solute-binding protein [Deltaproteobacteria bacterium]|nr:extracellular solute-binding protein [Deltaproteobacteria bacterium]
MKNLLYSLSVWLLSVFAAIPSSAATIEFWTSETQSDRLKTIQLLMDAFCAINPDINVRLMPVDENDMASQMAAASAAGNMPGLIEASSELIMAFGGEGIIDVENTTEIVNGIGKDRFYRGALKMVETPAAGRYYGLPYHGWVQGIWYREDWFRKEGLEPPDTWENILKAARVFYKPEQNQYGILIGTNADVYSEQCFTHLALSNGANEFNSKGELIFNSRETMETLKYYRELSRYTPPGPQTWRARDYYLQGRMAMFFYSTYIMDDLAMAEAAADSLTDKYFSGLKGSSFDPNLVDKTGVITSITGTLPATYGSIVALGIIKQGSAKHKEAIKKLVDFMYEPACYITFLHMSPGGMIPVLRDISGMKEYINDPEGILKRYGRSKVEGIIKGLDSIGSFAMLEGNTFPAAGDIYAKQIIPRMIYSVVIEGRAPEDAIARAEEQMKEVINR